MPRRLRPAAHVREHAAEEGPFVSFTDLFIGILFLFLILVAALMLMHQEAIQREKVETQALSQRIRELQAELAAVPKPKPKEPSAFRLGIAFNIYQRPAGADEWTFSRTVRIFRSPDGHCIDTVMVRSNLSTAWKPPVEEKDIPTRGQQAVLQRIEPCDISAAGDHWNTPSETGVMKRVSPDLYRGTAVLHKKDGDVRLEIEYRLLGVYDPYFR